jgi:putative FmdB family regulatory protein
MPLYDYCCSTCGPFRAFRPMRESSVPVDCPTCAEAAERMMQAPFLADMNPHNRIAHRRNEKSAHEPQVMSRKDLDQSGESRTHEHCHRDHHSSEHSASNWVRSNRPWMIGH